MQEREEPAFFPAATRVALSGYEELPHYLEDSAPGTHTSRKGERRSKSNRAGGNNFLCRHLSYFLGGNLSLLRGLEWQRRKEGNPLLAGWREIRLWHLSHLTYLARLQQIRTGVQTTPSAPQKAAQRHEHHFAASRQKRRDPRQDLSSSSTVSCRQLSEGTLEDNFLVDGSRITLLPRAETGLLVRG